MNENLELLQRRNSAPKLTEPAPSVEQMEEIFRAGLRAPDHQRLRPWRFITIAGERRNAFGELLQQCLLQRNPDADAAACAKATNAPLRAPLIVVTVVKISAHPKVPPIEQQLSAGCAAHSILLAAEACGFAGIWRTGDAAFDRNVMTGLGLSSDEEIIGLLYIGTRLGAAKPLPPLVTADYVTAF